MTLPIAILAGGFATRIRPLTEKIPKALVELNGEPFLAHQLRLLKKAGLRNVVICAWYRGELIKEFAGDGSQFGLHISYSFDGDSPLGTGGALHKALPLLGENFFVLYGDSYLNCNYRAIEKSFLTSGKKALMTVFRNFDQGDRSNVDFDNGQICVYDKANRTSKMEYIDYGLGIINASVFENFTLGQKLDLEEIYQTLLAQNQLAGFEVSDKFYEIGSFSGIKELEKYLQKME